MGMLFIAAYIMWLATRLLERALADARRQARLNQGILDGVADGIVLVGTDGRIEQANLSARSVFNGDLEAVLREAERGSQVAYHQRALVISWSEVPGTGRIAVLRDVTHELSLQRARSAMFATATHEMRTPLAAILGFADMLGLLPVQPEGAAHQVADFAERIRVNGTRLLHLLGDMLDRAQLEAGSFQLRIAPYDLGQSVREACENLGSLAIERRLSLTYEAPPSLPARGDANRLQQVLVNLVGNAIKFTDHGGVHVTLAREDQTAVISVQDSGIGIPEDQLAGIFEPFRQGADYAVRTRQGAGLGLSISQALVTRMGGSLSVQSQVGQGSTFTVRIPITMEITTNVP